MPIPHTTTTTAQTARLAVSGEPRVEVAAAAVDDSRWLETLDTQSMFVSTAGNRHEDIDLIGDYRL